MNMLFKINEKDNCAVALAEIEKGSNADGLTVYDNIPFGHKVAISDIKAGEKVIKYGNPIGVAQCDIPAGAHIHSHNLKTLLSEEKEYNFTGAVEYKPAKSDITFMGYERENGEVGIRNDLWIIPTVGCVNNLCRRLEAEAYKLIDGRITSVKALTHPYGCSQMGDDCENTQKALAALANHPNAGAVLIVSLGCENNNLGEFVPFLGEINNNRVKFLVAQDEDDEFESGVELLKQLIEYASAFERTPINISKLKIGLKCGGSDAFSGITANPLCGRVVDKLTDCGASAMLTEVPEMFGAEHLLMQRSENEGVFENTVKLINSYKEYFISHNQTVYENPSPGNKAGGITTLEEKSLGCIQKGGSATVTDTLGYADKCSKNGLSLLYGPGNDIVSTTNLAAAGAHLILFTTGRGTPLASPVPTVKISTNSHLAAKKRGWIDFNAGVLLEGVDFATATDELFDLLIRLASGEKTKNEIQCNYDIAIFKNGVTM